MKICLKYILFLILLFSSRLLVAQLSEGGYPLEITKLKSFVLDRKIKVMPAFDIKQAKIHSDKIRLNKSVKYAHSFDVAYTPEGDGEWFETDKYKVWQLHIQSEHALSLNVIFTKYCLPPGARLFIFNPQKSIVLGAFTNKNNKPYKKLACYPVPGDELVIQYEEPFDAEFKAELEVGKINHDFLGVVSLKMNRWGRRLSGECNIDVNCETTSGMEKLQRSVCRVFSVDELGTGTIINNTANNGKPYFISAYHTFDVPENAELSLFDFNYESPMCTGIDGYDNQTISGATTVAAFDSLDFMLMILSELPPANYRPYYAGWDATNKLPVNSYTIHHPNGDVKKISHDSGTCDSMTYAKSYLKNGQWKVLNWESGTTEAGSSGAALLNNEQRVVGTLTGGNASCTDITYDSFSRFDKMWNYSSDSTKQLKCWLDSMNLNITKINGFDPYESPVLNCSVITNFRIDDELKLVNNDLNYYSINEVAERFNQIESGSISGVSIGIEDFSIQTDNTELIIRIYTGNETPAFAEKQYRFPMTGLTREAMNYFDFNEDVFLEGNFFISVSLSNNSDSISLYQSENRTLIQHNTMLVNDNGIWTSIENYSNNGLGASLLIETTVCGLSQIKDSIDNSELKVYPNPAKNYLTVELAERKPENEIRIYDRVGHLVYDVCFENRMYFDIDVSNFTNGIYFISIDSENLKEMKRFLIYR